VTVLSVAAATAAAAALAAAPAGAAPETPTSSASRTSETHPPGSTRTVMDRLYHEAEQATEAYNRATERRDQLAEQVIAARSGLARGQQRINSLRGALGVLAGAQYRTGGIDPTVRLILTSSPEGFLDRAAALDRVGIRATGRLDQVRALERALAQDRAEADRRLAELEESRLAVARHKRTVTRKLAAARLLLHALPDAQRRTAAGDPLAAALPAGPDGPPASHRAATALAAVRSALGRPYVWGASGPSGFDCSGLMQWAYAQAGVALPRTSQQQRYAGRRVPLSQVRPGDLVVYRQDASHVAMYMGRGQVIHAPHPGTTVRYAPVNMLPVSSVTRV
jgi:cell wall-associated NlpC family hydrolase